jgi:enterochelin esterase family protein
MLRRLVVCTAFVTVLVASGLLRAQQPPAAPTPEAAVPAAGPGARGGGRGAPPIRSPEVGEDGRVTFRLRGPNATAVAAMLGGKSLPMLKDAQGVWSVTTDPLAPDYYTYSLVVDGTSINDPANRQVQTSFNSFQSMFVVPGPEPWFPAAGVPRGAVARHSFRSAVAGDDRNFLVYTPPGYDPRRSRPYPVLYLLHGLGDDAERWMNGGAANVILDNLIAQGKAVPMVVVTTLGYGVNNGPAGAMAPENITGYTKSLLTEVIPAVERSYHVSRNRDDRAIAGLSMGGAETLYTALNNLDRFAWVASFSGAFVMWPRLADPSAAAAPAGAAAPGPPAAPGPGRGAGRGRGAMRIDASVFDKIFPAVDSKVNSRLRMLWITCGTADSLIGVNRQFKDWLRSKGIRFTEEEAPEVGHVWPYWRKNLAELVTKVFQRT